MNYLHKNSAPVQQFKKVIDSLYVVTTAHLKGFFPEYSKNEFKLIMNTLKYYKYISKKDNLVFSTQYNYNCDDEIFGNDIKSILKCTSVLIVLSRVYNISYYKLCHYPSTIKFLVKRDDGTEAYAELIYVPYDDTTDSSVTSAKRISFFHSDEYDETFDVQRIVVLDKKYQYSQKCEIEQYIKNINSYAVSHNDNGVDVEFFD